MNQRSGESGATGAKLFIKTRGKRGQHILVLSDPAQLQDVLTTYQRPCLDHTLPFAPEIKPEADEWLYVTLDDEQRASLLGAYCAAAASSADCRSITRDDYQRADALYVTLPSGEILLSKISARRRIVNRHLLLLGDYPTLQTTGQALELPEVPDAYYDGLNMLYFKQYSTIRSLLPGLEHFLRQATDQEARTFLASPIFLVDQAAPVTIGIRAARQIAAIMDNQAIDLASRQTRRALKRYATKYRQATELFTEDDQLRITSTKDINQALALLTSRYYTSELTGQQMEAVEGRQLKQADSG